MKIILSILILATFGIAHAETNAAAVMDIHSKEALARIRLFTTPRQDWITNYYGKTLSSLGEIDTIRITPYLTQSTPSWTHRDLWQIIEESKVQDYPEGSHFVGIAPSFTIEYVGGLKVQADRYNVLIILPNGRKCSACLEPTPSKP